MIGWETVFFKNLSVPLLSTKIIVPLTNIIR